MKTLRYVGAGFLTFVAYLAAIFGGIALFVCLAFGIANAPPAIQIVAALAIVVGISYGTGRIICD